MQERQTGKKISEETKDAKHAVTTKESKVISLELQKEGRQTDTQRMETTSIWEDINL